MSHFQIKNAINNWRLLNDNSIIKNDKHKSNVTESIIKEDAFVFITTYKISRSPFIS